MLDADKLNVIRYLDKILIKPATSNVATCKPTWNWKKNYLHTS